MEVKTRNRLIYFLIGCFLMVTILIGFFFRIRSENENTLKQSRMSIVCHFSKKPVVEYSKDLSFSKGVEFKITYYSKTRSPIEKLSYQNNDVFVYKLPVKSRQDLCPQILKIKYIQVSPASNCPGNVFTNLHLTSLMQFHKT